MDDTRQTDYFRVRIRRIENRQKFVVTKHTTRFRIPTKDNSDSNIRKHYVIETEPLKAKIIQNSNLSKSRKRTM